LSTSTLDHPLPGHIKASKARWLKDVVKALLCGQLLDVRKDSVSKIAIAEDGRLIR